MPTLHIAFNHSDMKIIEGLVLRCVKDWRILDGSQLTMYLSDLTAEEVLTHVRNSKTLATNM